MSEMIDLTGKRFGHLLVIKRCENSEKSKAGYSDTRWLCECDCGNKIVLRKSSLLYSGKSNCGCIKKSRDVKHGFSHTRLHGIWIGMRQRCFNMNNSEYHNYGARGISVCEEWTGKNGAENFIKWALGNGYADNLSIERIDVNGNYCPSNCKWIPIEKQVLNKRNSINIHNKNETSVLSELCKNNGVKYATAYGRYKKGLPSDAVLSVCDLRKTNSGRRKYIRCTYDDGSFEVFQSMRMAVKRTGISDKKMKKMIASGEQYKGISFEFETELEGRH